LMVDTNMKLCNNKPEATCQRLREYVNNKKWPMLKWVWLTLNL